MVYIVFHFCPEPILECLAYVAQYQWHAILAVLFWLRRVYHYGSTSLLDLVLDAGLLDGRLGLCRTSHGQVVVRLLCFEEELSLGYAAHVIGPRAFDFVAVECFGIE